MRLRAQIAAAEAELERLRAALAAAEEAHRAALAALEVGSRLEGASSIERCLTVRHRHTSGERVVCLLDHSRRGRPFPLAALGGGRRDLEMMMRRVRRSHL